MTVYFSVLLVLSFLFIFSSAENCRPVVRKMTYFAAAVILTLVSGLRYMVGTDYVQYTSNYSSYLTNFSIFSQPALSIVAKISSFIYNDYATWFFLMAVITVAPVIFMIVKRNKNVELAILLYVLIGCWHFSFNIVMLVAPVNSTEVLDTYNLTGRKAVYQLAIPKGDTNNWTAGTKVSFFGEDWRIIELAEEGIESLVPLQWNKKVRVERYEQG